MGGIPHPSPITPRPLKSITGVELDDVLHGAIHVVLTIVLTMLETERSEDDVILIELAACHVAEHRGGVAVLVFASDFLKDDGALLGERAILSGHLLNG